MVYAVAQFNETSGRTRMYKFNVMIPFNDPRFLEYKIERKALNDTMPYKSVGRVFSTLKQRFTPFKLEIEYE